MKNKILIIAFLSFLLSGCSDFLTEKNETDLSTEFIYNTPEGIGFAVTALYSVDRDMGRRYGENGGNSSLSTSGLMTGDDITFTRAGDGDWAGTSLYDPTRLTPNNKDVEGFWEFNYKIIGRANEIIYYALQMDQTNPLVKQALGETYCFRAHAYFNLLRRFDNIYFTTEPVTPYTVNNSINYMPADQAIVSAQMKSDLDFAITNLSWSTTQSGRFTQGAARHIKALVDMWPVNQNLATMDLDDAIVQVEAIKSQSMYALLPEPKDVFLPSSTSTLSAKISNSECILVQQWSNQIGGAPSNTSGTQSGHRLASATLTRYDNKAIVSSPSALITDMEQGGVSWGRIYPNDYLLGLYDKVNDKRYNQFFRHNFTFNNITTPLSRRLIVQSWDLNYLLVNGLPNTNLGITVPANVAVGQTLNFTFTNGSVAPKFMVNNYALDMHPSSTKYFDKWTRTNLDNPSYKDVVVYRLAETFLIGAEAYLRKGNQAKALEFYNKTWVRAGNTTRTAVLSLQDILDEDARELSQENLGHRWYLIKRFGASTMEQQIKTYAGSSNYLNRIVYSSTTGKTTLASANATNAANYQLIRTNFDVSRNTRWPIPQSQINAMGGNYPQNSGY